MTEWTTCSWMTMRSKQWYTKTSRSPKSLVNKSIGTNVASREFEVGRKRIKRGPGKRILNGKDFQLAEEIEYIQRRAAEHDGRFVTVGPLALFSTGTGDAWLLDPSDQLAARLARDGEPEELYVNETETNFAIDWKGSYRIDGAAFIYTDRDSGRVVTILGYPTQRLARLGSEISNMFD